MSQHRLFFAPASYRVYLSGLFFVHRFYRMLTLPFRTLPCRPAVSTRPKRHKPIFEATHSRCDVGSGGSGGSGEAGGVGRGVVVGSEGSGDVNKAAGVYCRQRQRGGERDVTQAAICVGLVW